MGKLIFFIAVEQNKCFKGSLLDIQYIVTRVRLVSQYI